MSKTNPAEQPKTEEKASEPPEVLARRLFKQAKLAATNKAYSQCVRALEQLERMIFPEEPPKDA